jgi:uncharacterized membrane protein YfcA
MKRPQRRQTVALEVAALVVVLVSASALNTSPAIGAVGAAIVFLAASFSRHQRHGCERLRSLRVLCIGAIAGLAIASSASRATPRFLVALAVLAGLVWAGTNPDVHRALSARLRARSAVDGFVAAEPSYTPIEVTQGDSDEARAT